MITASIVTYNTDCDELMRVLQCVADSLVERVYVVDNSSSDSLRASVSALPKMEYIWGHGNIGYGSAHNIAIRKAIAAGAKYHVVLNPDIYFENGVVESLLKYMDEHEDVGQVMPKVFYPDGRIQYLCKLIPTPVDLIFKRFLPSRLTAKRAERFQLKFTGYNKEINAPYLSGCFMFFRTAALKEVGLFDERFFMYPEDIDISRRVHRKFKTMFYPSVSIVHAHAAASKTDTRMLRVHMVNMIKYFNKWGWLFDKERRHVNTRLLEELNYRKKTK